MRIGSHVIEVEIERPAGANRSFSGRLGPATVDYPVDYGHVLGCTNPQDGEWADIFVGSDAAGQFGRFTAEGDRPAEYKWYAALTIAEYRALLAFWFAQDADAARDFRMFAGWDELLADVARCCPPATQAGCAG